LIITLINWATKLMTSCDNFVCRNNLRDVMNTVRFQYIFVSVIWSYSENRSIRKIIIISTNSLKNSFTSESRLTSLMIILFIFIAALIMWYWLNFFLIRNQKFQYESWQDFSMSCFICFLGMSMIIWWSVLKTEKLSVCHASCDIVQICCEDETMSFIFLIFEKSQIIVTSLLNNIFSSKFFSCRVKASSHIILFARFKVSLNSQAILKNLKNSQWLYFSDFISVIFNLIQVSKIYFQFVKSSDIESFNSDEFTDWIFWAFLLYAVTTLTWSIFSCWWIELRSNLHVICIASLFEQHHNICACCMLLFKQNHWTKLWSFFFFSSSILMNISELFKRAKSTVFELTLLIANTLSTEHLSTHLKSFSLSQEIFSTHLDWQNCALKSI